MDGVHLPKRLTAVIALCAVPFLQACNVIVGDSVLWQSSYVLDQYLDEDAKIDGVIGRGPENVGIGTTNLQQAITDSVALLEPGDWIVVQEAGDHNVTDQFVRWVTDTVPDTACLGWVTPNNPARPSENEASVAAILNGIVAQPCHGLVRWDEVDTSGLTTDGLHLNEAGISLYAGMIEKLVEESK